MGHENECNSIMYISDKSADKNRDEIITYIQAFNLRQQKSD